jgi:segregation and condensation protein B
MVESATQVRDTAGLMAALEAVLFTLNRPVTVLELQDILQSTLPDIEAAATSLGQALAGRGLFLQRHQDQLQLVTDVVRRVLRPEYPSRLSPAAYETLAIIAYRQPLTRARIEEIRGVNCEAVLESLEEKGLIEETGRLDAPGTPRLFGTTMKFLQILGLRSLDELPPPPQSASTSS